MISVDAGATASYVYDAFGQRVQKNVGGLNSEFVYDQNKQLNTVFGDGSAQRTFVYIDGHPLAEYFDNTTYFIHTDHLGSTRILTELNQSVLETDDYYPYGELIPPTGGTGDIQKFTGKERDSESGLDNFGARYNASSMGRFMSPDPNQDSGFEHMDDPQSWNGYAYVRNSPTTGTDPDGRNYTICDSNGKNCADLNEDQYKQYLQSLQGTNTTVNSAGQIQHTNDNGSVTNLGTATYYNEKDIQAAQFLVQTGKTLGDPRTIAGFYGRPFCWAGVPLLAPLPIQQLRLPRPVCFIQGCALEWSSADTS